MATLSNTTVLLGHSEREYIQSGVAADCRLDGRACHEFRPYVIVETAVDGNGGDPLILSHGSARLLSANSCSNGESTQLLCSVKAELVQPALHQPHHGVVEFHVDTLVAGVSRRLCDDLQASLTHLLGNSVVDTATLCVLPHVYVWRLQVDVYIVSHAGSLLDAASRVIRAALQTTLLPAMEVLPGASSHESINVEQTESSSNNKASVVVDGDIHHASHVPGVDDDNCPIIVTVSIIQSYDAGNRPVTSLVLDATAVEEACAVAQVHVTVQPKNATTSEPTITAVRKTGTGGLNVSLLPEITKLALKAAQSSNEAFARKVSNEPASSWLLQGLYQVQ